MKAAHESNSEEKRILIKRINNSGINITPLMLDIILSLDDPLKKISLIIKEMSFLPTFDSHLTENALKKSSNQEILKILKRTSIKEEPSKKESNSSQEIESEKNSINKKKTVINQIQTISSLNSSPETKKKEKLKIKPTESIKSNTSFKPIAKNYDSDYEILKDPTGKLYTTGSYGDFYEGTLDKFNKLYKLMRNRPEALSATKINNIFRNSQSQYLKTIGLVKNIRLTKKGNFFITIEDQTGYLNVIARKDSENRKLIERIVEDQMILVEGTYNPGEDGKKGVLFANNLFKIEIPLNYEVNKSTEPLSIAFISDTHIGSKEFEEKLWNRFVKFLNGKIGNSNEREIAGKVKYLIINGDLVDGVGIYPNQQKDLKIIDIYQQFKKASEYLSKIPDYIKIFYSSGNHDPVRNAIPRPAVPKKYVEDLINMGVECIGNPATIKTHNVNTLIYHGDSLLDMALSVPGLEQSQSAEIMKEFLKCRHLAPTFGRKTQIAPTNKDWLVIEKIPDIFHTGHMHINDLDFYNNIALVNSGCFQSQTDFMRSFGITPTPGIVPIIELDTFNTKSLDFKNLK